MSNKSKEMYEQTRLKLIDAFWSIYRKKSIEKIRVQEITDLAGYHRNSFYRYFTDIYDLLDQVEDKIINEIIETTDSGLIYDDKNTTVKRFLKVWEENDEYLKILADEKHGSHFQLKMTKAYKKAHREMFVYSENEYEDDYIWEQHIAGTISALMHYYRDGKGLSLEEVMNLMMEFRDSGKYILKYRER